MPEKKLIMIVDDEEVIRDIISGFLEKKGYETVSVPDGSSALSFAEKKKPDIVLLDIKMPGIDGLETCARLKKTLVTSPTTGIIMITGYDTDENVAKSYYSGAVDVLRKPFDLEDLNQRISAWFTVRNIKNEITRLRMYSDNI